jgi:hypothetical protein
MKKLIVALSAIVLGSANIHAQKNDPHFGLRVGANFSNIIKDGDNDFSTDFKVGFNAAAFLEIPIVTGFSVQPELQYSQKGYKANGSVLGTPYEYRVTTNYVEIPLLAKFSPSSNFGIVVGPQFSFLTSTSTKFITNNATYQNDVEEDNDNLKKNVLGGVIGIEATSSNVVFGLRYSIDFQNNNGDGSSSTPKYKNQVIGLSVGFKL